MEEYTKEVQERAHLMEEQEEMHMDIIMQLMVDLGYGGGAGNPGGLNLWRWHTEGVGTGDNGTGGLLIIYTNEFLNNGNISSNGSNGGIGCESYGFYYYGGRGRRLSEEEVLIFFIEQIILYQLLQL